jgi:hypothetical protein
MMRRRESTRVKDVIYIFTPKGKGKQVMHAAIEIQVMSISHLLPSSIIKFFIFHLLRNVNPCKKMDSWLP